MDLGSSRKTRIEKKGDSRTPHPNMGNHSTRGAPWPLIMFAVALLVVAATLGLLAGDGERSEEVDPSEAPRRDADGHENSLSTARRPADRKFDFLHLAEAGMQASRTHRGDLSRLRGALKRARDERRPLKIAFVGGSFSAGAGVANIFNAFPYRLAALLNESCAAAFDATPYNLAQGASFQTVPMLCLEPVLKIVAGDELPDVYVVEFAVNLSEQTSDSLLAIAGSLLHSPTRSNGSAVILAAVVASKCVARLRFADPPHCWFGKPYEIYLEVARKLDLPLISFMHGIAPTIGVKLDAANGLVDESWNPPSNILRTAEKLAGALYAKKGEDIHFNQYGHRLFAEWLLTPFLEALEEPQKTVRDARQSNEPCIDAAVSSLLTLPPRAVDFLSRLASPHGSLQCRLTLTHRSAPNLIPTASDGFELQVLKGKDDRLAFQTESDSKSGEQKGRDDIKRAYASLKSGAWIEFVQVFGQARELCVLSFGTVGMELVASIIRNGSEVISCPFPAGVPGLEGRSLYWMGCGCNVPEKAKGEGEWTVRISASKGLPQVAGLAVF